MGFGDTGPWPERRQIRRSRDPREAPEPQAPLPTFPKQGACCPASGPRPKSLPPGAQARPGAQSKCLNTTQGWGIARHGILESVSGREPCEALPICLHFQGRSSLSRPRASSLSPEMAVELLRILYMVLNSWRRCPKQFCGLLSACAPTSHCTTSPEPGQVWPPCVPELVSARSEPAQSQGRNALGCMAGGGGSLHHPGEAGRGLTASGLDPENAHSPALTPWSPKGSTQTLKSLLPGQPHLRPQPLTSDGQDNSPHHHDERLQGIRVDDSSQAPCRWKRELEGALASGRRGRGVTGAPGKDTCPSA